MKHRRYSSQEVAWLLDNHTLTVAELCKRFAEVFGRSPSRIGLQEKRRKLGLGIYHNGVQIRPITGNRTVKKDIGTERIRDGIWIRKMMNGIKQKGKWKPVHRIRWEEENGPIPDRTILRCIDCNRLNTDPSNWQLVSLSSLLSLNGLHGRMAYNDAPSELRPVLMNLAKLEEKTRSAVRREPAAP